MYDISIIVVSWNTKSLVRECLSAIRRTCERLAIQVLLIDNASSDGTPSMVAEEFPEVVLIRNAENLGFARANNQALKLAQGKFIALVNSDVTVLPDCLQKLVRYMEQEPSIGMLGPRMLTPSGRVGPSCMREPCLSIWLAHALGLAAIVERSSLHISPPSTDTPQEVDVLNGWFWVVRRTALERVGPLDERFFMYGEDIDWCCRFRKAEWKVVYYPGAAAIHYGGGSSSRDPVRFYVEMQRARLQYWRLRHSPLSVLAYLNVLLLHQVLRVLGYGVVYLVRARPGDQILFKIKRSAACLRWLFQRPATSSR